MKKISKEDKKKYQTVSRIAGVFTKIGEVFCYIGAVGCLVGAGVLGILSPNLSVDTENKKINLFDESISYEIKDHDLTLGETKITIGDKELDAFNEFIEKDLGHLISLAIAAMSSGLILLVVTAIMLNHSAKVFKNIAMEDTPFTEENITHIEKVFRYMIIAFCISIISSVVMELIMENTAKANVSGGSIVGILGTYVLIYIFKAGYQLEGKSQA